MAAALIERVGRDHATALAALFQKEWWTRGREVADVVCMLEDG